jgi:hypothetical protein
MNLNQTISLSEILLTAVSILAAGLGYIIREQKEKIKTIQNQLSDKKYTVYHEIYAIFFDLFKEQKGLSKASNNNDVTIRLIDIKKDLFIYAPDNIVEKFLEWNNMVTHEAGNKKHFKVFLELFVLIRKDMGQKETKINSNDILRSITSTEDDYQQLLKTLE